MRLPRGLSRGGRHRVWRPPQTPRYLVTDVDGTLVGPSAAASDGVAAGIVRAQAAGIAVGFATGRMRLAVQELWRQLRASGPHVLHNGAEVRAGGRTVAAWPIDPQQLDCLLTLARAEDLYAEIYLEEGYLVTREDERARPHWTILGHEPLGVVRSIEDLSGPVLKATFALFDGQPVDPVLGAIDAAGLRAGPAGSPLTPTLTYVNATDPAVDKGRALVAAASHLGVDLADTVAVGDAPNDLSMFAVAGTAVAMGQAPEEVRAMAHLVAPPVEEDGLAVVLDALAAGDLS